MKVMKKLACYTLVVLLFSALASTAAFAVSITFSNSLNIRMSVTMAYVDEDSGIMTTKGWWHVEPDDETVITVDADESSGVYYAAYNKGQYYDSNASGNSIKRWANPRTFTYTSDEEPYDDGVWYGTFYRIDGNSVNIDTDQTPRRGALGNSGRTEESVSVNATRHSSDSFSITNDAEDREELGDRISTEYLSQEEIEITSTETLAYLRNRIYANHGYSFKSKQWSEEFSRYDWYEPNPNFSEALFNGYEKENLRNIMAEEKRR